jgi:type I restriction enzyme S subunit
MVSDQWTKTTLGNSAHIIMGASPPGTSYNEDGQGLPLLNGPAEFGLTHPTPVQWTSEPTQICKPGDVLLCVRGSTTGRQNIADQIYCIGRGLAAIRANEKSHGAFIKFSLEQIANAILQRARGSGSTFPNINSQELRNWSILLPPLPEQKKIAAILSSVDEAIASTQAVIDQTRKVKQGLLQHLLTRGLGHTKFKESAIGEIPESWEVVELRKVCNRITVGLATSITGYYKDKGVPLIRNLNIKNSFFDGSDIVFLDPDFCAVNKNKAVKANDVITVRTGANIGLTCLVPEEFDGAQTFTTLITRTNSESLLPQFLVQHMNSPIGISEIERLQVGGGKSNLNAGDLAKYKIAFPNIEEQKAIAKILDHLVSQIIEQQRYVAQLTTLKRGLMQDLLTGLVRV